MKQCTKEKREPKGHPKFRMAKLIINRSLFYVCGLAFVRG
jgi:hypothetical protein